MTSAEFIQARKRMEKTQKQMAELLGASLKAIHSYEQGWRNIPVHIERQVLFLLSRLESDTRAISPCWEMKNCPDDRKAHCPAWEFHSGSLCWFVNGTMCEGTNVGSWEEKMNTCHSCDVFESAVRLT